MRLRLLVGLIGIPTLFGIIWLGFPFLAILVGIVTLLGLWEFYQLTQASGTKVYVPMGLLWAVLFVVNGQLTSQEGNFAPHLVGGSLLATLVWALSQRHRGPFLGNWFFTAIGPLYVGLLLSHALMLREAGNGIYDGRDWLLYALFTTFATDTGAYFVGRAVGRRKLAPVISPGKTWEGATGGLIGAVATSIALTAILNLSVTFWQQVLLGLLIGTVAQLGDLMESTLKRRARVKNTGSLIPGHGGVLDRIDSLLVTIPVTYYILALIID